MDYLCYACVRIATSALVSFRYVSCMDTCRMSDVTQHTTHNIHTHTEYNTSLPIRLCVALSCLSVRLAALALLITSTSLTSYVVCV